MAIVRIDRFGGLKSAPTTDAVRLGDAIAGFNYRLTAPGSGRAGLRPGPGRTRVYRDAMDLGGEDRLELIACEPEDFNRDTGAVLFAADQSDSGKVLTVHQHEDLARGPYEPPDDEPVAVEFVHEEFEELLKWSFITGEATQLTGSIVYVDEDYPWVEPVATASGVVSGGMTGPGPNGNALLLIYNWGEGAAG